MIGHQNNAFENSGKTGFSNLFSDGKPAEISRDLESTAPFVLFTRVVLRKPRFGAGQLGRIQILESIKQRDAGEISRLKTEVPGYGITYLSYSRQFLLKNILSKK